jgi:hypothetical protein
MEGAARPANRRWKTRSRAHPTKILSVAQTAAEARRVASSCPDLPNRALNYLTLK